MFFLDVFLMCCGLFILYMTNFMFDDLYNDFGPRGPLYFTLVGLVVTAFFAVRLFFS